MDFLSEIIDASRRRLEATKQNTSLAEVQADARVVRREARPHRLVQTLRNKERINIIAEFKRRSPSKGDIKADADAVSVARVYESAGAVAISVLTEEDYFAGSLADLRAVRGAVSVPILRKDFIFDEYQVYESAAAGADALLLITAALDDRTLRKLRQIAEDLGLDALVEVHTGEELTQAVNSGARLIGVNNRDLHTFTVSVTISAQLARIAPSDVILVSESGLNPREIQQLHSIGYSGFLVGEALMRAADPAGTLRRFMRGPSAYPDRQVQVKICGITNLGDARAALEAGADLLGFNFYSKSPRFIEPEAARGIISALRSESAFPGRETKAIGVFVNEALENVVRICQDISLDGAQLHGEESAEYCQQFKTAAPLRFLIKVFPAKSALDPAMLQRHPADAIMLDSHGGNLPGGTGRLADWKVAAEFAAILPCTFLAGGLSPENVGEAIAAVNPHGVDACSALEISPGKKDHARMKEFVDAVRASKLPFEASAA